MEKIREALGSLKWHGMREDSLTRSMETYTASIPSSAYLGVAAGAMGLSLLCQVSGRGKWGNFIAQWVPTWLIIGLYNKVVKTEGHDRTESRSADFRRSSGQGPGSSMRLRDFINYRVEVVNPEDTLQQVAEKMRYLDVGSMPVCEGQHLIGVVTDRDITVRAIAQGQEPTKTRARDVMTSDVVYCFENQSVAEVAKLMQDHQIRRIFVLNENEELIGVTSLGELATATGDQLLAGETLERISEPVESKADDEQHPVSS